ncbi:Asp23/Gls24 family envelope stress response protein [Streptomyces sp. NPDC020571]|uniref:Asp23/Gls24 family envelope stress response protein n=1 Tax=Streptomyces sp. NPDC020571 TaxID=3365079 RepID=UPI0037B34A2F
MTRAVGCVRELMPGGQTSVTRGVRVEVGECQVAVDRDVVTDHGFAIPDVVVETRADVVAARGRMTGLEVVDVNIDVNDVSLPEDEDAEENRRNRQRVG